MDLQIRLLSLDEIKDVYNIHMKTDFPRNELRTLSMINKMVQKGTYYSYGIFEGQALRAYAFLLEEPVSQMLLFDYFAVCKEYRRQGYGTEAMKQVFEVCNEKHGMILEVEDPMAAKDETEKKICEHRISFYERCGIQMSEVRIWLFGVTYCMMYKGFQEEIASEKIIETMECLYQRILPKLLYKRMFRLL